MTAAKTSNSTKPGSRVRLQFDFSPRSLQNLDELVEVLDAASRAEVVRNALYTYAALMDTISSGGKVVVLDKNGEPIQWMYNRPPV